MSKQIKVIVNGNPYEVEIGDMTQSPMDVVVNGKSYSVSIENQAEAVKHQESHPTENITNSPRVAAKAPAAPSTSSSNELRAPLPGQVVDIVVKPGDKVKRGDPLLALDAMKMKNAIRSPRDGVIQSIPVTEGQKVAYNDILVTYE